MFFAFFWCFHLKEENNCRTRNQRWNNKQQKWTWKWSTESWNESPTMKNGKRSHLKNGHQREEIFFLSLFLSAEFMAQSDNCRNNKAIFESLSLASKIKFRLVVRYSRNWNRQRNACGPDLIETEMAETIVDRLPQLFYSCHSRNYRFFFSFFVFSIRRLFHVPKSLRFQLNVFQLESHFERVICSSLVSFGSLFVCVRDRRVVAMLMAFVCVSVSRKNGPLCGLSACRNCS